MYTWFCYYCWEVQLQECDTKMLTACRFSSFSNRMRAYQQLHTAAGATCRWITHCWGLRIKTPLHSCVSYVLFISCFVELQPTKENAPSFLVWCCHCVIKELTAFGISVTQNSPHKCNENINRESTNFNERCLCIMQTNTRRPGQHFSQCLSAYLGNRFGLQCPLAYELYNICST